MGSNGFSSMVFTTKGLNLMAKVETGTQLQFTRMGIGDGILSGQDETTFTQLIHQVMSLSISTLLVNGAQSTIGAVLSNAGLAAGFYWREIGLFAQDPDLGEILFGYDNSTGQEIYVPDDTTSFVAPVNVATNLSNASSVTATITPYLPAHASSHETGGSDPIPLVTELADGFMSHADKAKLDGIVEVTESTDGLMIAADKIKLDAFAPVAFALGTLAARPAAGTANRMYFATDKGILSFDSGTSWVDFTGSALSLAQALTVAGVLTPNGAISGICTGTPFKGPIGVNLLPNSSFRLGGTFWTGIGSHGFGVTADINGGALVNETNVGGVWVGAESINLPAGAGVEVTLSGSLSSAGITAGGMTLEVHALDVSLNDLGFACITPVNGTGTTRYATSITLPANTRYVQVRCTLKANTTLNNNGASWELLKLEYGSIATPYTAEADLWPALTHGSGGSPVVAIGQNSGTKVQFGSVAATSSGAYAVTFPTAFNGAPVVLACYSTTSNTSIPITAVSVSATGSSFYIASATNPGIIMWMAIGN